MLLTPKEIKDITFNSSFEEAICLSMDFRFFYFRCMTRGGDIPFNPKYLDDLCQYYQSIADLTIKEKLPNLTHSVCNIFPGAHKTTVLEHFIAWCYIREVRCNFIVVSMKDDFAVKIMENVKILIESKYIQSIFNITIITADKGKGELSFDTGNKDGILTAAGIGGSITSRNANVALLDHFSGMLICDDPHGASNTDVEIESAINAANKNFQGRVRRSDTGLIGIMGQMVSRNDLSNYTLNTYGDKLCHHFKVAALDRFNNSVYHEKFSRAELIMKKKRADDGINTDAFYLQMQQQTDYSVISNSLVEQIYTIDRHEYNKILFDTPNCKIIRRAFALDPSLVNKDGNPSAICAFTIVEKTDDDKKTYKYYLDKIYNLTYKYFEEKDIQSGNQAKPNYFLSVGTLLRDLVLNEIQNETQDILVLIEGGREGTQIYDKINSELSYNSVQIEKISPNKNTKVKDPKVKQSNLQSALANFCTEPNIRFYVVKQPELEILKKQVSYIGRRSGNDDIVDCVSMFLNYQYTVETNLLGNSQSNIIII